MLKSRAFNILSSLLLCWLALGNSYGQTTLLPGDLVVVTANISTNQLELIPLINIDTGTELTMNFRNGDSKSEPVTIRFEQALLKGQRLVISKSQNDIVTKSADLDFSSIEGFLTISQPDEGIQRKLFAMSWGNIDTALVGEAMAENSLPYLRFGEGRNFQYHLKNGASGTPKMLLNMITNLANWRTSQKAFGSFQTSLRLLDGSVIVFDQNVSTVQESDSIRLNVAIYEHDGSKLTVDVKLHEEYSTADTNDVNLFKKYTFNFTGLIGDAVYEKTIPLNDDTIFEGRETAFFELDNLSAGQFGDFISHAAFILDNEIPNINAEISLNPDSKLPLLSITNNERVYLDVNNWLIQFGDIKLELSDLIEIAPFEKRWIELDDFIDNERLKNVSINDISNLQIITRDQQLVKEIQVKQKDLIVKSDLVKESKSSLEVEITDEKLDPLTVSQIEARNNVETIFDDDSIATDEIGWRPFDAEIDLKNDQEVLFWDERRQFFRAMNTMNQDSVHGLGLMFYGTIPDHRNNEVEQFVDSTLQLSQNSAIEWTFRLSATDANENGFIDGAEGLNLIQNKSKAPISVSALMALLGNYLGESAMYPYVFGMDLGSETYKSNSDFIAPNALFWLKADTTIEQTEIVITPDQLIESIAVVGVEPEPVSTVSLQLSSEVSSQSVNISLFDAETLLQKSVPNLSLELTNNRVIEQGLQFGLESNNNWFSKLNLAYTPDAVYILPIGVRDSISAKMTVEISDWNLEGGWLLYIEDTETNEQFELIPGVSFSFEYLVPNQDFESGASNQLEQGKARYRLLMVPPGVETSTDAIPEQIELFQNYPNPFNPATTISFYLPESVEVSLSVFNVVGQPVATLSTGILNAGEHHFEWNATGYPSGMYIYQLEVGTRVLTRKMTLVK